LKTNYHILIIFGMLGLLSPVRAKADVGYKLKHKFNSQLCQKYLFQKLLKSANLSSSYDR